MKEGYPLHAATVLGSKDQTTKDEYAQYCEANADQIERLKKQWTVNEAMTKAFLSE
jgi:hypothetical protein